MPTDPILQRAPGTRVSGECRPRPRPNRVPMFLRRLAKGVVSRWTHSGLMHHFWAFSIVHRRLKD
ncbi:hypothetical protein INR49_005863 [Caranx melampygus]|nr:hypothetical protein INR49_005863 [Caranx melampygus]